MAWSLLLFATDSYIYIFQIVNTIHTCNSCCAFVVAEGAIARFKIKWCILGPKTPAKWGGKPRASNMACSRPISWSSISSETVKASLEPAFGFPPDAPDGLLLLLLLPPPAAPAEAAAAVEAPNTAAEAAAEAAPKSKLELAAAPEPLGGSRLLLLAWPLELSWKYN